MVRGLYDVAGLRADADFMIWTRGRRLEAGARRTLLGLAGARARGRPRRCGAASRCTQSGGVRREPRAGVSGRGRGRRLHVRLSVVRSLDWYLLPDERTPADVASRRGRPREPGCPGRRRRRPSALSDDSSILAFEGRTAPDHGPDARVRAADAFTGASARNVPFFTGPPSEVDEVVAAPALILTEVTSPALSDKGPSQLVFTRLACEGRVQPIGGYARRVHEPGRDASIAGIRRPLGWHAILRCCVPTVSQRWDVCRGST